MNDAKWFFWICKWKLLYLVWFNLNFFYFRHVSLVYLIEVNLNKCSYANDQFMVEISEDIMNVTAREPWSPCRRRPQRAMARTRCKFQRLDHTSSSIRTSLERNLFCNTAKYYLEANVSTWLLPIISFNLFIRKCFCYAQSRSDIDRTSSVLSSRTFHAAENVTNIHEAIRTSFNAKANRWTLHFVHCSASSPFSLREMRTAGQAHAAMQKLAAMAIWESRCGNILWTYGKSTTAVSVAGFNLQYKRVSIYHGRRHRWTKSCSQLFMLLDIRCSRRRLGVLLQNKKTCPAPGRHSCHDMNTTQIPRTRTDAPNRPTKSNIKVTRSSKAEPHTVTSAR